MAMQPSWITEAAHQERWLDAEWGEWEGLRGRMHELGVETIEPTSDLGGVSAGGRELGSHSEPLQHHEERPVLAALHRLEAKLSEHVHGKRGSGRSATEE
jgi:hypothetical protein